MKQALRLIFQEGPRRFARCHGREGETWSRCRCGSCSSQSAAATTPTATKPYRGTAAQADTPNRKALPSSQRPADSAYDCSGILCAANLQLMFADLLSGADPAVQARTQFKEHPRRMMEMVLQVLPGVFPVACGECGLCCWFSRELAFPRTCCRVARVW